MGWMAIITLVIQIFGPVLAEWLKKWLESRLEAAAMALPSPTMYSSESAAQIALFDKVIEDLPRLAFARRNLVKKMRDKIGEPISESDMAMFQDLANAASEE